MTKIKALLVLAIACLTSIAAAQQIHVDPPFLVRVQNKFGFMDESCHMVVPAHFDEAFDFTEGLAAVQVDGRWGYIDPTGKFVIQPQFAGAFYFSDGLASVKLDEQSPLWGFIDKKGAVVIKPQFGMALSFSEGLVQGYGEENGILNVSLGYVNKAGRYVIRLHEPGLEVEFLVGFSEGLARVSMQPLYEDGSVGESTWGYIDHNGRWAIPHRFPVADDFHDGLASVADERRLWGYIDKTGQFVIAPRFDCALSFSEGMAAVRASGKWGFIDRSGAVVITPQFEQVEEFHDGMAMIAQGRKAGYINRAGEIVVPPTLDSASEFTNGVAVVSIRGRYAVMDAQGHTKCELTEK